MIINKFQSLEHLNQVFNQLFDSPYITKITPDTVDVVAASLDESRRQSIISLLNLNINPDIYQEVYIYLGSKTDFKKNIILIFQLHFMKNITMFFVIMELSLLQQLSLLL